MGDFDDMNATPLGKLPMPAVQSKSDAPRLDTSTSYADILKTMNAAEPAAPTPQAPPMYSPSTAYSPPPQITAAQYYTPPARRAAARKAVAKPTPKKKVYVSSSSSDSSSDDERRYKPKKKGAWLARIKEYKTSILVTVVVLLVLLYVSPRLAQMVPRLLTPTGKFNFAGLFILSAMSGGIHRVADTYIKFK